MSTYYNGNRTQVAVKSTRNPEKVYFFPPKATLTVNEELRNLPPGLRKVSDNKEVNHKK